MNTLHFTYAVEVARCGSMTRAAENLYMAQSNLSKAIKELENTLGYAVFERTSRGVTPTARGREFLTHARAVLAQLREMEALAGREQRAYTLSAALPGGGYPAQVLTRLLQEEPRLALTVREEEGARCVRLVAEGRCRLGVARYPQEQEEGVRERLREQALEMRGLESCAAVLLLPRRHPLAARRRITPDDLTPYPQAGGSGGAQEARFEIAGTLTRWELLAGLPDAYAWSLPEPEEALARFGLTQRACAGAPQVQEALIYAGAAELSPLEKRFAQLWQAGRAENVF